MQEHDALSKRWSRAQLFTLSTRGRTVAAAYRANITAAQGRGDHNAFETARSSWAVRFELLPDDGAYLAEVGAKPSTLRDLDESMAICGQSRDDVFKCVRRLVGIGLMIPTDRPSGR